LALVRPGDMGITIRVPDRDPELQNLVGNINGLLSRIGRSYAELSEFAAAVAHELRTPLTLLRLRVEESAASLPPEFSEDLQEEIQRMSRLVERTLTMSRAEGGLLALQQTEFDLSGMLSRLHEDYGALAQSKDIDLAWDAAPDLSATGDGDTARQILHNLIDNALRYGGRKIALQATRTGKGKVSIEITNDLPAEPHTVGGTGLGLRLVKSLTRVMPGWEFEAGQAGDTYRARLVAPAA
jgi:signal transduction histidine kinase